MEIIFANVTPSPKAKCTVTVTPGTPLRLSDGNTIQRATAECNVHGVIIAGSANLVMETAVEHAS